MLKGLGMKLASCSKVRGDGFEKDERRQREEKFLERKKKKGAKGKERAREHLRLHLTRSMSVE
jgi:hypothetical protein